MLSELENLRNEIRNLRGKDNTQVIRKCFVYLSRIHKIEDFNTTEDKLFCYHDLALAHKKLGKINEAIKYELVAINYANPEDYRYICCRWLLAGCYEETGDLKEAIKNYTECSKLYKAINEKQQRICIIWNKAKLLKNTKAMLKIIHIYETEDIKSQFETYGGLDNILKEMYEDLLELYIVLDKRQESLRIIYGIKDINLKKELYKRYVNKVA